GFFERSADGVTWVSTTTFTTADLAANHVRFTHDGTTSAPSFSVQANDGALVNNLSAVVDAAIHFSNSIAGDGTGNILTGSTGNDTFQGFAGNDTIVGLAGVDLSIYSDATAGINVNMAAGTVTGDASIGTDTLQSIEQVRGSNFADVYD